MGNKEKKNLQKDLGFNAGPLALQAIALTTGPWLLLSFDFGKKLRADLSHVINFDNFFLKPGDDIFGKF